MADDFPVVVARRGGGGNRTRGGFPRHAEALAREAWAGESPVSEPSCHYRRPCSRRSRASLTSSRGSRFALLATQISRAPRLALLTAFAKTRAWRSVCGSLLLPAATASAMTSSARFAAGWPRDSRHRLNCFGSLPRGGPTVSVARTRARAHGNAAHPGPRLWLARTRACARKRRSFRVAAAPHHLYLVALDRARAAGLIAERERRQRRLLHLHLVRLGAAA